MKAFGEHELHNFIYQEARLLDERRWDEWLALFDAQGRYWVPLNGASQPDDGTHNSIADEDRLLLSLRIDRLRNPRAHSQHPASHCQHVLQRPELERSDPEVGLYELRSPFIYHEARGACQVMLTGCYRHRLVRTGDGLRIRLKRVDLLNPGAALPAVQLFP